MSHTVTQCHCVTVSLCNAFLLPTDATLLKYRLLFVCWAFLPWSGSFSLEISLLISCKVVFLIIIPRQKLCGWLWKLLSDHQPVDQKAALTDPLCSTSWHIMGGRRYCFTLNESLSCKKFQILGKCTVLLSEYLRHKKVLLLTKFFLQTSVLVFIKAYGGPQSF